MKKALIVICLAFGLISCAADKPANTLTKEQAIEDIQYLSESIEKIHPDFYDLHSQKAFYSEVNWLIGSIDGPISRNNFFLIAGQIPPLLKDGHTSIRLSVNRKRFPFPLDVKIDSQSAEIRVTFDYSAEQTVPVGAHILSINGVPADEIVNHLEKYVSGERRFFRLHKLSREFAKLFYLNYRAQEYMVEYELNGETLQSTIAAVSPNKSKFKPASSKNRQPGKKYGYHIEDNGNIAVLTLNSFMSASHLQDFKSFLRAMFQSLKEDQVKHLIIDIRNNPGGNTQLGDALLQYISAVPFKQFEKMIARNSFDRLKSTLGLGLLNPFSYGDLAHYSYDWVQPNEPAERFHGKVYLLVSHQSFSAASDFSEAFKQFDVGLVIGEETGGMNVSLGENIHKELPNTGWKLTISCKKSWAYGASEAEIHGTLPDIHVPAEDALRYTLDGIKIGTLKKQQKLL